jgi:hypothetical protein
LHASSIAWGYFTLFDKLTMSESDDEFEAECESCSSSDEGDEGEIAEDIDGGDEDIPAAQRRLIVVRGREPYMFEPMAPPRQENMEVDGVDNAYGGNIAPAPINYDERLGNTNWYIYLYSF